MNCLGVSESLKGILKESTSYCLMFLTNTTAMVSNVSFHLPSSYAIPLTVVNSLSSFIGSVANILVIITISKSTSLHRVTDSLILSLACADLTVTAIMEPLFTYHINYYIQTDGTLFDVFHDITGYVSNLASISLLLVVTVDRLIAIRLPLKYKVFLSKRKVTIIIIITWICSFVFGVVFRVFQMHAALMWSVCSFLLLGTLLSYPYIFYAAHRQERLTLQQLTLQRQTSREVNITTNTNSSRRVFAEKKATKTVAIVVCFYSVCWIPILVYTQVKRDVVHDQSAFLPGFFVVYTLSMLNSTFNPFIYCVRNRRYRDELRALYRGRRAVVSQTTTAAYDNKAAHDDKVAHDNKEANDN